MPRIPCLLLKIQGCINSLSFFILVFRVCLNVLSYVGSNRRDCSTKFLGSSTGRPIESPLHPLHATITVGGSDHNCIACTKPVECITYVVFFTLNRRTVIVHFVALWHGLIEINMYYRKWQLARLGEFVDPIGRRTERVLVYIHSASITHTLYVWRIPVPPGQPL